MVVIMAAITVTTIVKTIVKTIVTTMVKTMVTITVPIMAAAKVTTIMPIMEQNTTIYNHPATTGHMTETYSRRQSHTW